MAGLTFSEQIDEATIQIATTAQRTAIRTAITDCNTAIQNAYTALSMPEPSKLCVETMLIDLARQIGADSKAK